MPKCFTTKLSKTVALKKLSSCLDRVVKWNREYSRYFGIDEIVLVGSLARNDEKVGDIDLCFKLSGDANFCRLENKNEYIEFRKREFGFMPPRDYGGELHMYVLDPPRYIKGLDGRIDLLRWDQLDFISLTMDPIVTLIQDGQPLYANPVDAIANAKPISMKQAEQIVEKGHLRRFSGADDEYWQSYCQSLNKFPRSIREMVLARDETAAHYYKSEYCISS